MAALCFGGRASRLLPDRLALPGLWLATLREGLPPTPAPRPAAAEAAAVARCSAASAIRLCSLYVKNFAVSRRNCSALLSNLSVRLARTAASKHQQGHTCTSSCRVATEHMHLVMQCPTAQQPGRLP